MSPSGRSCATTHFFGRQALQPGPSSVLEALSTRKSTGLPDFSGLGKRGEGLGSLIPR